MLSIGGPTAVEFMLIFAAQLIVFGMMELISRHRNLVQHRALLGFKPAVRSSPYETETSEERDH